MDILLVAVAFLLLAGFVFAVVKTLAHWRSGWRIAALVPLAGVAFVAVRIVIDTHSDPTSHNLWPFEIVMAAAVALAALGLLAIAHRMAGIRGTTA